MKEFFLRIFSHFSTIKDDPGKFILWCLISIVLSLSSVWIPILIGLLIGKDWFALLMADNPFILFSIVFLSDSLLTSINTVGAGSNRFAVNIRGITLAIIILYLFILLAITPVKLLANVSLSFGVQSVLLGLAILLGIYVYGFREVNWEKSVADVAKAQSKDIDSVILKAENITTDGSEVKL